MFGRPLDNYFKLTGIKPDFELTCSACWRGYIGTWEILDGRLFLTDLSEPLSEGTKNMQTFFPDDPVRVFAYWYSGQLRVPQGEKVVHPGSYSSYECDLLIDIENGVVQKTEVRENELPTVTTAEESAAHSRHCYRVMALIKRARDRGFEQDNSREYLTYDEINIHLEEDKLDKDRMENILKLMGNFGITVCDEAPKVETILNESKAHDE